MENLDRLIENVTEAINLKKVDEVMSILTSLLISAAIAAEIDQEELEEFLAEAVEASYDSIVPEDGEYLH